MDMFEKKPIYRWCEEVFLSAYLIYLELWYAGRIDKLYAQQKGTPSIARRNYSESDSD